MKAFIAKKNGKSQFLTLALLGVALLGIVGCAPPYRQKFWDEGNAKGWTEKQKLAAFAYADRVWWAQPQGENKYVVVYRRVPVSKVREQLDQALTNIQGILDPKDEGARKYIEAFNLREDLKHDYEIVSATEARVKAAELDGQFKQGMGEVPSYGPEAEMANGYDIKKIFLAKSVADAFPFTSEQIEGAKKDGTLKLIEDATLDLSRTYDRKEADPAHTDDPNEFIWKGSKRAIHLSDYKIITQEKPDNNNGDYIEGTVLNDGVAEPKPRLKIFFPPSGGLAIVLIDTDKVGDPGFGIPDILQQISGIKSLQDVIRQGSILDTLFKEKPKQEWASVPKTELFKIEIAKVDAPVNVWETAPDSTGWLVPFKYQTTMGDNYNVRIKYEKPKDMTDMDHAHSQFLKIEYIEKEYTTAGQRYQASQGAVTEFYKPKGDFAGLVQAKVVFNEDTKKLDFIFPDGNEITGFVTHGSNKFIEDKPYAKSYTEGGKRYWIEKSSGSDVFDKRKQVGPPKEKVGDYSTPDENQPAAQSDPMGGMDMDRRN